MTPVLAFDIETIPDVAGIRRLHELPDELSDSEVAEFAFQKRRAATGNDFLPLHLQRVIVISCALREARPLQRLVAGRAEAERSRDRPALLRRHREIHAAARFLERRRLRPAGAALPRPDPWRDRAALLGPWARTTATSSGTTTSAATTSRHLDLMDLLALYQPRASAPLDELAKLMGLPGKLGMDGSRSGAPTWTASIDEIRDYCETDVVNTYLVYLRFQRLRGALTAKAFDAEVAAVRAALEGLKLPHWQAFLAAWET
jgi:hypothetical protein